MTNVICPECKGEGCIVCGNSGSVNDEEIKERIEQLKKEGKLSSQKSKEEVR